MRILNQRGARPADARRGAVLILALIVVVTVSTVAAGFLQLATARSKSQITAVDRKRAMYLAEAGLAESYLGLRVGKTGVVGSEAEPAIFGNGLCWVEVEDLGNNQLALHGTGMSGRASVALDIVVERLESSQATYGLYTQGSLSLGPGTRVDSYDSTQGSWDDQFGKDAALEGIGSVGTGGDLELTGTEENPVFIRGDVSWGPTGELTKSKYSLIGGQETIAAAARVLPPVELPDMEKEPGVAHSGAFPLVVPSGNYALDSLVVGRDAEVVIEGPSTLLLGGLALQNGARLVADTTDGAVEVFVETGLALAEGSTLENSTADPTAFVLQYAGDASATISSNGAFHGVFYAPEAEIVLAGALELFGSLIVQQLTTRSGVVVHFDRALLEDAENENWPCFLTWRILEMDEIQGAIADPFVALGVDPALLEMPADSHADQVLDISYLDGVGAAQTYNGLESGFDWSDVSEVTSATRDGGVVVEDASANVRSRELDAAEVGTLDSMNAAVSSAAARTVVVNASPVTDDVLIEAMLSGKLDSADARDVLITNSPLSDRVLATVYDGSAGLVVGDLNAVAAAQP